MQITDYQQLFDSFKKLNVLIIGDVMVDAYIWGGVSRISPEAPVPIVSVDRRENRLGGAANVALNIKAMGANPILCSVVGKDLKGEEFISLLRDENLDTTGIVLSNERVTTTKFRILGNNMQLLRVDEENSHTLNTNDQLLLKGCFTQLIKNRKIDVIIFQDYDKGVITPEFIAHVTDTAREKKIPLAVDPKKRNFTTYKNVNLFKPNLKELKEGLNLEFDAKNKGELKQAAIMLRNLIKADTLLITLSEDGVFIDHEDGDDTITHILPSHVRSVSDVSGAGDTVISVAALCLVAGVSPAQMAFVSNLAGGLVCESLGVVPVDSNQLLNDLIRIQNTK